MVGIYKIVNKVNGKFYIGQSVDIVKRWSKHKSPHRKTTGIAQAVLKYGPENFRVEIIEQTDADLLCEREMYWIRTLRPHYNMNRGGKGNFGRKISIESRLKISLSLTGRRQSPELITKRSASISKAKTGVAQKSHWKHVIQIFRGAEFGFYPSVQAAANDVGIHPSGITSVLKGRQKTAGGFEWKLLNEHTTTNY